MTYVLMQNKVSDKFHNEIQVFLIYVTINIMFLTLEDIITPRKFELIFRKPNNMLFF